MKPNFSCEYPLEDKEFQYLLCLVNFKMRPWTLTADYWTVYFEIMETCKIELDKAGIEIPYPQVDIHKKN